MDIEQWQIDLIEEFWRKMMKDVCALAIKTNLSGSCLFAEIQRRCGLMCRIRKLRNELYLK